MDPVLAKIGAALRAARGAAGVTQRSIAEKAGVAQVKVSTAEAGAVDLRTTTLVRLARSVGLELMLVPRELIPAVEGLLESGGGVLQRIDREAEQRLRRLFAVLPRQTPKQRQQLRDLVHMATTLAGPSEARRRELDALIDRAVDRLSPVSEDSRMREAADAADPLASWENLRLLVELWARHPAEPDRLVAPGGYVLDGDPDTDGDDA